MFKSLPVIGLAALLAVSAGCTMQPKYTRPVAPIPASWPQTASTTTSALPDWRQVFTDARLRQLIDLALVNNRDLRVAALNVQTAQARYRIQRSQLLPSVGLNASGEAQHLPAGLWSTESTGATTYHQYDVDIGVTSYELDLFGRVQSLRNEALESYFAQTETRRATQISLIAQVATTYLTLCADSDFLELAKNTARNQAESYRLTKQKYDGDVATQQDLVQAETSLRSAQADISTYTRQVEQDQNALAVLIGTVVPTALLQDAHLGDQVELAQVPTGLPAQVLIQRPDILAAEHQLKSANADIGAARAAFFPTISLTATGGTMSGGLSKLFDGGTGAWTFMPSISLPIFTGGRNRANLDVAKLTRDTDVANYEKAIQTAFREVSDALAGIDTYATELEARNMNLLANDTNFRLATLRYDQGVDDYLAVLVAQRLQYQASQSIITARLGLFNQRATLFKALGGGWNAGDVPAGASR